MADQTPIPDPPASPGGTPPPEPPPAPPPGPPPAKPARRHRRWLKIVLSCAAGILLFIAIGPTLLSMGWARRFAENKANQQLRGKLQIGDWSIGWFTGARLGAVNLYDATGQPVLQLTSADTHLSISDVLRGNFDLGTVPVTGLRLFIVREPNGTLNLENLLPPKPVVRQGPSWQPAAPPPPPLAATPPPKLPNISVDLELTDCQATFSDAQTGQSVTLPISGSVKIPNINQPITNDLKVAIEGPKGAAIGVISLAGSIAAVQNDQLDSNDPAVDETLKLSDVNLSALQPMFARGFTTLAGHGGGEFSLRLVPHAAGSVNGSMTLSAIEAAGKATRGDTFAADAFTFTAHTALPTAAGLDALATTSDRFTTTSPIAMVLEQGQHKSTITFDVDAAMSALHNLAKNLAPGSDGKIQLAADIDIVPLANELPHLIRLRPGMSLRSGEVKAGAGVAMSPGDATPTALLTIANITGAKSGKSVTLKPITLTASVRDIGGGRGQAAGAIPKLQDLQANLSSAFATGALSAPTPSQITGTFTAQLADMQKELGQVFDFGSAKISGAVAATVSSQLGESADDSAPPSTDVHGSLVATNLRVDRSGSPAIDIPAVDYALAATVFHNASLAVEKIGGIDVAGTVGSAERPALATHLSADLTFGRNSSVHASNVKLSQTINVPELRHELGSTDISEHIPSDYALKMVLAATAAYSPTASNVDISTFSVTDNHGLIAIQRTGPQDIRFAAGADRQRISPGGTVSISADLAGIEAMLSAPSHGNAGGATLQSGHLAGTLALSGDSQITQFNEEFQAVGMTVLAGQRTTALSPVQLKSNAEFGPGDDLTVKAFSAQGAGGEVHLKQPLIIAASDIGPAAIHAELAGGGDIGQMMAFLAAFESAAPPAIYSGRYSLDQVISTTQNVIAAKGAIHSTFSIAHQGNTDFAEPDLSIVDDLSYDQAHGVADLANLSLDMHGTGALRLALCGKISDLSGRREFKGVSATLHYDAAGLWKLIYATLTPEQRESYKDVKLSGAVDREFTFAGSYPADQPFNQAVKSLTVRGGIALPGFQGDGMTVANLDLPLSLKNGLLLIAEPTPATINGGTLNLAGLTVDLGDPHDPLSIPDNTAVLKNVSLNPVFVKKAAGWVNNPLFIGTDNAAGILNLTVDHCDRLPTDDLVKATTPDNTGTFRMQMALGQVQIGAPMLADVSKTIGPILGGKVQVPTLEGEIPNYTLDIARGIMTTDMTMNLTAKKHPLKLAGTVELASEKLNMRLDLPTALLGGEHGPLAGVAGQSLKIPITGTVDRPKFEVKSLLKKNLKNPGKELKNIFKGLGG